MQVLIDVSLGELIDKLTILQIKAEHISDEVKLININKELMILSNSLQKLALSDEELKRDTDELKIINESLWDIEDDIREKEAKKEFDEEFIALARAVYVTNDKRAAVKKRINLQFGSDLVEEKSYQCY